MSTVRISQLDAVPTLLPAALVEIEQSSTSYKATVQEILDLITVTSVGAGAEVIKARTVNDFDLRSIVGGTGITVTQNTDDITIDTTIVDGITSVNGDTTAAQVIAGTTNRITINDVGATHTLDIASTYVGQATITTLGTITTGVWNGTAITYANLDLTGGIVNADVNASAAIDATKIHDGSVSNTEFGYLNGVTSSIQTQIDSKITSSLTDSFIFVGNVSNVPVGVAVSGDVAISNTGVISISAGVIVDADINASAAINATKIHDGTVSNTEFGYLNGVTSAIQTQIDSKLDDSLNDGLIFVGNVSNVPVGVNMTGDIAITNAGVTSISAGVIVNADVSASAAIDFSKLATLTSGNILVGNVSNVATSVAMSGDATLSNAGVITIANNAITTAKILDANVTTSKLADDNVTYAKIQNVVANNVILGNNAGAGGIVDELTGTEVTAILDTFTDLLQGLAPASGGGTTNFLRADGTWATPAGGSGDVVGPASATDNAVARFDSTTGKLIQNSGVIIDDSNNVTGLGTLNTHTIPAGTSTFAIFTDNLSVFAATTSAQLAGVISDETGSGVLVFGTSPTITTPFIAQINDTNGNEAITFTSVASAVNYVDVLNSATSNNPRLSAAGGDTNIGLALSAKGTGIIEMLSAVDMGGRNIDNIQNLIFDISTSGTDIDFDEDDVQEISISSNTTFTTANRAAGKQKTLKITTDATQRDLTFPAGWKFLGTIPANQAASKVGQLSLLCYGTADTDIVAAYSVEE